MRNKMLIVICLFICLISIRAKADADDPESTGDVKFHGTIAAPTCNITPGDEAIAVDLKTIAIQDLYRGQKSTQVPFSIHLEDCSAATFSSVSVTFSGTENPQLPNHVAVIPDQAGEAEGIGLGIQQKNGTSVQLGVPTPAIALSEDFLTLDFQVFIEGEPAALQAHSLKAGGFHATVNYTLNYQ